MTAEKCGACGGKGGKACPALAGRICPPCCGSKRLSSIACTPDCVFNPFGVNPYDSWLRLDAAWHEKASSYVSGLYPPGTRMAELKKYSVSDSPQDLEVAWPYFVHAKLFLEPSPGGELPAEAWEREGRGLTNDERVLMKYRRGSFPAILEIQEIIDDKAMRCADLLDEGREPFIVYDRSTAARAPRYSLILTWVCHYPHFSRLGYLGYEIPRHVAPQLLEDLSRKARRERVSAIDYLRENFMAACRLARDITRRDLERLVRSLDSNPWTAAYALRTSRDEIAALLSQKPEFRLEESEAPEDAGALCYDWLRVGESKEIEEVVPALMRTDFEEDGVGILGRLRLYPDRLVINVMGERKYRFAREKIEKFCGERMAFSIESERNLREEILEDMDKGGGRSAALQGASQKEESIEDHIPPEILRDLMQRYHEGHYRRFLDEEVPALGGMTPRQAAARPEMPPALISLMKDHLNGLDRRSRDESLDLSIDWVLDELGLSELK